MPNFLYEELDTFSRWGSLSKDIPDYVKDNLNPRFELRPYQVEAFSRFFHCFVKDFPGKQHPLHLLFNMATGSGKTLIMAGLILYLYEQGYRNFLFFVNSTNIIEKTKENFLNPLSSKFLFVDQLRFGTKRVQISKVANFEGINDQDINICFTTIQKLHFDMTNEKENALTYEDFKDKKTVLIADEAHHFNVNTRNKQDIQLFESWENTVETIFKQNQENLLLEFTATLDYTQEDIVGKYLDKVIYKYDLRQFRNDGFSKDVYIVKSDFGERDRMLQALILSQYKQEVAAKNRINLKPVILFKAQRTIEQSKENKAKFHELIENLTEEDITRIRNKSQVPLMRRAFEFFDANSINDRQLAGRLKTEFQENRCLSVNEKEEKENYQILLNTLEENDNHIRAIFAVQKLNEGWDVLNLFDIVRCYTTRDSAGNRPGKTTIAEAQLIGRGARYFPFVTPGNGEKFCRKFDKDLSAEMRVMEELHYHSLDDSRYIDELRKALIEEGMLDKGESTRQLELKDSFLQTDFYQQGLIYFNEKLKNRNEHVRSFADLGVSRRNCKFSIATGYGSTEAVFSGNERIPPGGTAVPKSRDLSVAEIPMHIKQAAIARQGFFTFKKIKHYCPGVSSLSEFIQSTVYLGGLGITFEGNNQVLENLSHRVMLDAFIELLNSVESQLRENVADFVGSEEFIPNRVSSVFKKETRDIKVKEDDERAQGDEAFIADKDWYAFKANYGTSEEKDFVRLLDRQIETLRKEYDEVFLLRNERHFKIYKFQNGQAFEPDYVLFLRKSGGEMLTLQMFIEPKGRHLLEFDREKEQFLIEIKDRFKDKILIFETEGSKQKYRLLGVPFFNSEDENNFRESFFEAIKQTPG